MTLFKSSLIAGGSSLRTYLKGGNNIHTEPIEEWIVIEDQSLIANTTYLWKLTERNANVRLVSLWATTTGQINVILQSSVANALIIPITSAQAAAGFIFPTLIIPTRFNVAINAAQTVSKIFLFAKEISVTENLTLIRQ